MEHLYLQGLLLILLMVVSEGSDVSSVIATQEEGIVLPCFDLNAMESCFRAKWIKRATDGTSMKVILAWPKTPEIQDAERVKWERDGNGHMSLFLTKVQKSDEGLYSCEIWHGWKIIHVKNMSLKVKECKALQAVKAMQGTRINLMCPVNMTSGQQGSRNSSWVMLKGGNPVPVNSKVVMTGTSLAIQSVDYTDNGWYRCNHTLGQTQRCFDINLLVQAMTASENTLETGNEGSSGAFIAVVASVVIVIAIIAALIGLFIYRRRNTQRVAQQAQRHPAGTHTDSTYGYEIVTLTRTEYPTDTSVNSIYHHVQEEDLCTFQY